MTTRDVKFCSECGVILHRDHDDEGSCENCNGVGVATGAFPVEACNTLTWLVEYGYSDTGVSGEGSLDV